MSFMAIKGSRWSTSSTCVETWGINFLSNDQLKNVGMPSVKAYTLIMSGINRVKNVLPDPGDGHDVPLGGDVEVPQIHGNRDVIVRRHLRKAHAQGYL